MRKRLVVAVLLTLAVAAGTYALAAGDPVVLSSCSMHKPNSKQRDACCYRVARASCGETGSDGCFTEAYFFCGGR